VGRIKDNTSRQPLSIKSYPVYKIEIRDSNGNIVYERKITGNVEELVRAIERCLQKLKGKLFIIKKI
jgi:hypothetical protein